MRRKYSQYADAMSISVKLDLTKEDVMRLESKAIIAGYLRDEPRDPWTQKERAKAIRWFIEHMAKGAL